MIKYNSFQFQISILLSTVFLWLSVSCIDNKTENGAQGIVIENEEMRLVLNVDGTAQSLIHKATGQECLDTSKKMPAFSITQYRPYDNEVMLAYPAKKIKFAVDSIYRIGDDLIASFELTDYEATIGLNITDDYIGFTLKKLEYHMAEFGVKRKTNIDEFTLMQLPVKDRTHFGGWLNVVWDEDVAINLLATNPYAKIDAEKRDGYKLLLADAVSEVKLEGVGAALIVTDKDKLLDRIDQLERDFGLPLGVESRRSEMYKFSYYELTNGNTKNIDEHIAYAKKGGFRQIIMYHFDFSAALGHFPWTEDYPNGMADLKEVTQKIRDAGIIPGVHIHYNKATKNDLYVSPVPDSRLNLTRYFTLAKNMNKKDTVIYVEENPAGCTMENERRFLKFGNELITYENYTTTYPYKFTGCQRGALETTIVKREKGDLFGLLDVDSTVPYVRFNQKTNIQEELAEKLGKIYREAGFQFIYFDGAEDAPRPYWFNIPMAKLITYNAFKPAPIFSEGSVKAHFDWHIQSRGNAFDVFKPEFVKEAVRKHPAAEAEFLANDFTSLNFGWIKYIAPGEPWNHFDAAAEDTTIGIQPDMFEYITSRAAAWDCPISMFGNLEQLKKHPRTADNLEVIRKWEEVRAMNFLTNKQKESLKNLDQDHTLLINEDGDFELVPYNQITNVAGGNPAIRAFTFLRKGKTWVVYSHSNGEGNIELALSANKMQLFEKLGEEIPVEENKGSSIIPAGNRRYIAFDLSTEEVVHLFETAKVQ